MLQENFIQTGIIRFIDLFYEIIDWHSKADEHT